MSDNPLRDTFDTPPSPRLKARVITTLQRHGHLAGRHARQSARLLMAAGIAAAAMLGFIAGRSGSAVLARNPGPQYLLLLFEDASYRDDRPMREIVTEYAQWADSLDRAGKLVLAEKLGAQRHQVARDDVGQVSAVGGATGFFIVRAENASSAVDIARGSPHVRAGGRIVIRPIDHVGQ